MQCYIFVDWFGDVEDWFLSFGVAWMVQSRGELIYLLPVRHGQYLLSWVDAVFGNSGDASDPSRSNQQYLLTDPETIHQEQLEW